MLKADYEAPNWHPDNFLLVNFNGKIYRLDLADKNLTEINTGSVNQIMDDHGLSPDGKWIAITSFDMSNPSQKLYKFSMYIVPVYRRRTEENNHLPGSFFLARMEP